MQQQVDRHVPVDDVTDAQRRLMLALRAHYGPDLPRAWADVCGQARVLGAGQLGLDELDRVAEVLAARGGVVAVAAGSTRVRLLFLRRKGVPMSPPVRLDDQVRAAYAQPDALDEEVWRRRLAEIEAEFLAGPGGEP